MLLGVEPDFKVSAKDVQEFLAFVRVGFAAAAAGFDAEKMGLHHRVSPGEQLHAHVRRGLQNFSLMRAHEARIIAGGFEEGKNIGAVEAGDAAQRGDGGAHLAALEGAEKTDGDASGASDLSEREAAARSQAAETLPGEKGVFRRSRDNALALEHVNDGGGIEAAGAAEENRALQQAHIGFPKEAGAALRTPRRDYTPSLPRAASTGRKAHAG